MQEEVISMHCHFTDLGLLLWDVREGLAAFLHLHVQEQIKEDLFLGWLFQLSITRSTLQRTSQLHDDVQYLVFQARVLGCTCSEVKSEEQSWLSPSAPEARATYQAPKAISAPPYRSHVSSQAVKICNFQALSSAISWQYWTTKVLLHISTDWSIRVIHIHKVSDVRKNILLLLFTCQFSAAKLF